MKPRHVVTLFAALVLTGVTAGLCQAKEPEMRTIDTPKGPIEVRSGTEKNSIRSERLLTDQEVASLSAQVSRLGSFAREYGLGPEALGPTEMDALFASWMADDQEKLSGPEVVDLLGAAFGRYLIDTLDMAWVEVTDRHGTSLAVKSSSADHYVWPFDAVQKRVDRSEVGFFYGIEQVTLHNLEEHATYGLDEEHPIPNLDVLDINAVKKGGGSDLIVVVASPLQADDRSLKRLRRKLDGYLEFLNSEEFRAESGVPSPDNTQIIVKIHRDSAPEVFELLNRSRDWVRNNAATLVVDSCLPEAEH